MAKDLSPSLIGARGLATLTTMVEASTQTYVSSPKQEAVRHHTRAGRVEQNKSETKGFSMTEGLLDNEHNKWEAVMDLKIRLAVLENELAHKERERKEAVNACGVIAKVLGPGHTGGFADESTRASSDHEVCSDTEKWRTLEREVKMLQMENTLLWRRLEIDHTTLKADRSVDSDHEILDTNVRQQLLLKAEGKGNVVNKGDNSSSGESAQTIFPNTSTSASPRTTSINYQEAPIDSDAVDEETKAWGQGPILETTTVPNSPVTPAEHTSHKRTTSRDIGYESLDEILGPENYGDSDLCRTHPIQTSTIIGKASQLLENGPRISQEMKQRMDSMILPEDLPAPIVLKTGFDLEGNFKGGEYSHMVPTGPRAWNNFNRLGQQQLSESYSSISSYEKPTCGGESGSPSKVDREGYDCSHSRGSSLSITAGFFRYGIRFSPSETDSNYMRRIVISNLPKDVKLIDVLARVRGGEVVGADLLNTAKLTGGMTVMVEFLYERSAEEYLTYTKDHSIYFGSSNQKAEITLVKSPSWPLSTGLYPSILQRQQTRCLAIPNFPEDLSIAALEAHVTCRNAFRAAAILNTHNNNQGTIHFEFSSMLEAQNTYGILTKWGIYARLRPFFTPDPCAGSVEELASPLPVEPTKCLYNQGSSEVPQISSDSKVGQNIGDTEHNKPYTTNAGQRVTIPSFSGSKIKSFSWADEVIEETDMDTAVLPPQEKTDASISSIQPMQSVLSKDDRDNRTDKTLQAALMGNLNQEQVAFREYSLRKPPVGLAGSKYTTIIPAFADLPVAHEPKQTLTIVVQHGTQKSALGENTLQMDNNLAGTNTQKISTHIAKDAASDIKHLSVSDQELLVQLSDKATDISLERPRGKLNSLFDGLPPHSSSNTPNSANGRQVSAPAYLSLGISAQRDLACLVDDNTTTLDAAGKNDETPVDADIKARNEVYNQDEMPLGW